MKIALTSAGSDSGGGAGVQADLKTFHQYGVYGTSVITAVTAQNTMGVAAVHAVPRGVVEAQLAALASDLPAQAVKTGMLANRELVETVAEGIRRFGLPNYVLDPVMVATSGDRLLTTDAEAAVRDHLMPLTVVVTPNLPEAELLSGQTIRSVDDMKRAGESLVGMGAGAALIKGGHGEGREIVDVLVHRAGVCLYRHPRIDTMSTHGTGCTLSAAVAAGLAMDWPLERAVSSALDFVQRAISSAPGLGGGGGHGPINHRTTVESEE